MKHHRTLVFDSVVGDFLAYPRLLADIKEEIGVYYHFRVVVRYTISSDCPRNDAAPFLSVPVVTSFMAPRAVVHRAARGWIRPATYPTNNVHVT